MMNKLMKKIAVAFTVAAMTLTATTAIASANYTEYVANDIGVNVRQYASASSARLGGLYQGDAVDVVADLGNGWTQINYGGRRAYVISDCLSYTKPAVTTEYQEYMDNHYAAAAEKQSHMARCYARVRVDSNYLALRSEPTYDNNNEIEQLYNGEMVQIAGDTCGSYVTVYTEAGNYGWVNAGFLQ